MLTKKISSLEGENMQTKYKNLGYRIDLYFHNYKLAIKIDENGHIDRNITYKIKKQKAIELEISWKFMKICPGKEDFDIFRTIN